MNGSVRLAMERAEKKAVVPQTYHYGHTIDIKPPSTLDPLMDHLGRVCKRPWLALLFCILGTLAGAAYLVWKTPLFRATARFEVTSNDPFMPVGQAELRPSQGYGVDAASIQTHILMLSSSTFRNRVSDALKEGPEPEVPPTVGWYGRARQSFGLKWKDSNEFGRYSAEVAAATMSATQVRGSRVIEVRCDSPSPNVAARFLNMLADEYMAFSYGERSKGTREVGKWVSSEAADAMQKLKESELKLQDYAKKNGIFLIGEKDSLSLDNLRQLQSELSAAQAERRQKESRLQMALSQRPEALPEFLSDGTLQSLQTKLQDSKRELGNLNSVFTPASEKYQSAANQVRETETILAQERKQVIDRIRNDFEAARRRQAMTASAYYSQQSLVTRQRLKMIQYDMLKRDVDNNQALYNNLLQQQSQTRLASTLATALPTRQIRILDMAVPPFAPTLPNPTLTLMTGFGAGFVAMNLLVFVRRRVEGARVRQPGDASALLDVRELGVVPSAPMPIEGGLIKREGGMAGLQQIKLKESMRMVMASLMGGITRSHRTSIFVITSPNAGEGKSTITSNLGMAVASATNSTTLVIDADCYRPRLHDLFGQRNQPGWAELIASPHPPSWEEIAHFIQPTGLKNLSLITAGISKEAHLLNPRRVRQLLAILRGHFQLILIDVPPMLQIADARMIATETDGVVLVLRSGVTPANSAQLASQLIADDGSKLIGAVLNDFDLSQPGARKYEPYVCERATA